ncbi:glycosyltransferase [Deinococcus metallilatus]|uniref:Glycosyltransferase family 4 protein n=1 Tax=Deinococcus metallilatus TaxID=1211322 RepID=A0AAJ5F0N4_9DEIO|nr:glycosyltransferase [Deinococcus metallilatus]MBB5296807.1 glycosyltransferase involved in cell wall biosynthesis [Deinococcus metallilatus]QBY09547.1 glycosyltransferase [Deinococcus metallilatus]RXJ09151.1 glycosyltransferase [Deinococcus metallilatus]TLK22805.1 glycosyltransferase family 4 protein [Deinococcus metallilatus]GMA13839.1 glycosyl transferase [Deinococcus metallilatus]
MGRPLRLMAVLPTLAPGGAEVQMAELLRGLPDHGIECELVTLLSSRPDEDLARRLHLSELRHTDLAVAEHLPGNQGLRHALTNLRRARPRLAAHIRAARPDVVYTRLWYAGVVVGSLNRRRLGFRHVANEENALDNLDDRGRVKRLLRRWVVAQADRWVAPTRGLHDELVRGGARAARGRVIHNATPLPERVAARVDRVPRLAAMGRLVPAKGFDRLLDAAAALRDRGAPFTLEIAGEGPERAALERQIVALGLGDRVRLVGYVASPLAFLLEQDVFVLSSRSEGFANVLAEAMACGLPAVAYDIAYGPNELILPGHTGLLVPDGDQAGMTDALAALATDPERRRAFGTAGRARAEEQFSVAGMTAQFAEVFFQAAGLIPGRGGERNVRNYWERA